jgi:hypothetical protein
VLNQPEKLVGVFDYTPANLLHVLCNDHLSQDDLINEKYRHFHFLVDYFNKNKGGHNAQTMVLEDKYLSKSYLQDYSNFYSTCYVDYKRFCKRVHFFAAPFSEEQFLNLILDPIQNDNPVWDTYLGYVVIRPLSKAIIGATLLKPYDVNDNGRNYTAIREYKINLVGKELKLKTLVYQEQDSVVGACASSALWSAFHKISMNDIFQTPLLSPSEVTKSVKSHINENSGRIFPNEFLTLQQVLESINAIGLVSELYTAEKIKQLDIFRAIVYAYNKMGLPVLLLMKFDDEEHHLVTITGYRTNTEKDIPKKETDLALHSSCITKFYAHDDQVGPFARLEFKEYPKAPDLFQIETAWIEYDQNITPKDFIDRIVNPTSIFIKKLATPEAIIIPLSDQIRIPFNVVYENLLDVNNFFEKFLSGGQQMVWEVFLEHSNKYKTEIFLSDNISPRLREKLLIRSLSKYVWVAQAKVDGQLFLEVVFDATNVADASFWKYVNIYNEDLREQLKQALNNPDAGTKELILGALGRKYLEIIEKEVK